MKLLVEEVLKDDYKKVNFDLILMYFFMNDEFCLLG